MRFTNEELAAAVAEFEAKAAVRVAPGFGHNKDITIYGAEDVTIQKTSAGDSGSNEPGTE
jgi:hypothetical protein